MKTLYTLDARNCDIKAIIDVMGGGPHGFDQIVVGSDLGTPCYFVAWREYGKNTLRVVDEFGGDNVELIYDAAIKMAVKLAGFSPLK